jgi:predicted Zn-dependent peptidase
MPINRKRKYPSRAAGFTSVSSDIRFKRTTLDNGIKILTEQVPSVSSFALGISINTGSRDDWQGYYGLAHFLEHAGYRHTHKRTSRQIASLFERLGAYTNAFTTKEITCYYVRALKPNFKKTLELITDVALFPIFIDEEIEKEKLIILDEIKSYYDDPEEYIFDLGEEILFDGNGLAHPITGVEADVEKITPVELFNFHKEQYGPENIIFSIAGNIDHDFAVEKISKLLENYKFDNTERKREAPTINPAKSESIEANFQQSHLLMFRRVGGVDSKERYPLAALNVLLGDGMSSRLYRQLRENHGLAYNIYSNVQLMTDCGGLFIYAGTEKKHLKKAERLIFKEMKKIIDSRIPNVEMIRIKEQLKSSTIMAMESMSTRMQSLAKSEFSLGYYEDIQETIARIEELSIDDIRNVAERYLKSDGWNVLTLTSDQ